MYYAKLIDSELVFAPRKLRGGENTVYNPPAALLEAEGYKPVVYTEAPAVEEGCRAVCGWTETADKILQTWTAVPEGDISDAEALEILLGGEGA